MIDALNLMATVFLGLYAGSLLTEAMILVPYWRSMPAEDFFRLHSNLGPRLFRFFAPLTVIAVISTVLVGILNSVQGKYFWVVAAVLAAGALLIFFIYFKKANKSFADHRLSTNQLPLELKRWAVWHWIRTIVVILAFATSVLGHMFG
jgi:uncharacterized membrane protein